ncbi:MAG: sulfotransferase family 2 domain-containing protein [Reyranellaceae bacterium]
MSLIQRFWTAGRSKKNAAANSGFAPRDCRPRPSIKDVVFVHIPKTAGSSLRNALVGALPNAVRIFHYGTDTAAIEGNFVDGFAKGIDTPEALLELRSTLARDQRVLVTGHVPAASFTPVFHPTSFITFLRDPVDRIVSSYRQHVRTGLFAGSFREFLELPAQINLQSRLLQGLDFRDLGFVGLFERMPDMVEPLSRHLGVQLRLDRVNVDGTTPQPDVDTATRARILTLNEDDVHLYRHVEANLDYFTNYRARPGVIPQLGRGKVYRTPDGMLIGWALAREPGQLAEVEIRIGDRVLQRVYADQFLPWLKNSTPHGVGGFQARLPADLSPGQGPIRALIAGTEKDLEGSPLVA